MKQKALLSHAKSIRWLLASLDEQDAEPEIFGIRVNRDEVAVILGKQGVLHNPSFNTLRGYKPLGRPKKGETPSPRAPEVGIRPGHVVLEASR